MNTKVIERGNRTGKRWALFLATAWLLPLAATAQQGGFGIEEPAKPPPDPAVVRDLTEVRSEVEVGIGNVSDDSFKFGKYTGLNEKGVFGVLDVKINDRGPYDGDSAAYWSLTGTDLGLDSRMLRLESGVQGNYKWFLEYDQIPTFRSESAQTIFDGAGGTNLTLPAGWVAGTTTAGMTQLLPSLKRVDIEHERRRVGVGFAKVLADRWNFNTSYRHESKEGFKTVGAVIGNSGGNPRAVILPEPIDYVTEQFDAVLGYKGADQQFRVGYYLSLFSDENKSLTWQNPYSAIGGWDASAGYPTGQGRLGLPPDNQFHQIAFAYGFDLSKQTRFNADLAIGRMTQDEEFLPYTVNPTLAASITQPLPRNSLDGQIDTTLLNLRLASRPTQAFHWNAALRYDDRNNKTPRNEYVYIGGDSQTQDVSATSSRRRFNEPYSYEETKLKFDAGYRFAPRTEVTAGAERSKIDRTYSEREESIENTVRLGLKSNLSGTVSAGARISSANRYGSAYVGEAPFLSSYSPAFTATEPGGWENHPDLRKYFLADRVRQKATLFATATPDERVTVGFNTSLLQDDYKSSEMGLTKSDITNYTLDLSYMASEKSQLYGFYTHEDLRFDQDGRSFQGFAKLAHAVDLTRDWFVKHRDQVDTIGLGFKQTIVPNRLDVGADYVYAETVGAVDVTVGSSLTAAPLPDLTTRLNSLSLYAKYKLKTDLDLKVRYWVEKYDSTDWALDNVEANQLANVILLGEDSPNYQVHVITVSVAYRF